MKSWPFETKTLNIIGRLMFQVMAIFDIEFVIDLYDYCFCIEIGNLWLFENAQSYSYLQYTTEKMNHEKESIHVDLYAFNFPDVYLHTSSCAS